MADRYLLESGAPDGYLLEDGSGVLLLEVLGPLGISYGNVDTPYQHKKQKVVTTTEYPNLALKLEPVNNTVPRTPLYVRVDRHQFSNEIDYVNWALYHPTASVTGTLATTNANDTLAASGDAGPVDAPPGKVLFIPTPPRKKMVAVEPYTNKLLTVYEPQKIASGLPESSNPVQKRQLPKVDVYSNWALFRTLNTITGTSSTTNANDTLAATGSVTVVGTLSRTNANDTSTGQGTTTVVGAGSSTNANDTLAASGSVGNNISGSLAYTNNNDTSTGQGSSTVLGVLATTNNNDTSTGQGTTVVVGTLARTNNNDTLSASGFPGNPPTATTRLPLTGAGT